MYHFNKRRIITCLYALLLLLSVTVYAQSQVFDNDINSDDRTERIVNFHSDIVIDTSGMIKVAEHITVYARGEQIKRGVRRQLPLYRNDKDGNPIRINMNILSVLCNNNETKYHTEKDGKNLNIYIGDENAFLSPGIYTYTILYESSGQIGFFDTFDELYWNVTGNEWDFNIEKASASITLPEGTSSIKTACYTGKWGSTQQACSSDERSNTVSFSTTHALKSGEGLTVAVSFPRDIIKRPPPPTSAEIFWNKYKRYICSGTGLLLFGCYFLFTWVKVGKDPVKPVVIPQFQAPHDRSPATVRYLYKKGFDDKAFTVSLISMAVKKAVSIFNKDKSYTLNATEEKETLSPEEKQVYETLFSSRQSIKVADKDHVLFSSASNNLFKCLRRSWNLNDYLHRNLIYAFGGAVLAFLLIVMYVKFTGTDSTFDWIAIGFVALLSVIYIIYVYLIKAPTKLGAQTQSELEGLKMYLKTAEENRWNALMPPEKTPELFEKLLPYAIALDVGNEWCKKFDDVLKQCNYEPDWYTGSQAFVAAQFGHSLASSFSSSLSSARIDPSAHSSGSGSWSSGSGGGGFSGGGGGGGGGGGW